MNDFAWLLATSADSSVRNGAEAVRLSEEAVRLTSGKEARFLGTLDAAYAEAGRFDDAIATVGKTRELAIATQQAEIARQADLRLAQYRLKKPYHREAPAKPQ
jgi:hypothetical protein